MWCPICQDDVSAQVSGDGKRIHCATCGGELKTAISGQEDLSDRAKDARSLLERWKQEGLLNPETGEPMSPTAQSPQTPSPAASETPRKPKFRVDSPHELRGSTQPQQRPETPVYSGPPHSSTPVPPAAPPPPAPPMATPPPGPQPDPGGPYYAVHGAHTSLAGPHFEVRPEMFQKPKRKFSLAAVLGQLLAYGGVGLITIGTAMVLGGYFGGPEEYAPTGWLTATVGQMLLFLGVVTLISSGMEQTSSDVSDQVENLGRHIIRMEHENRVLRAQQFAGQQHARAG